MGRPLRGGENTLAGRSGRGAAPGRASLIAPRIAACESLRLQVVCSVHACRGRPLCRRTHVRGRGYRGPAKKRPVQAASAPGCK